MELQRRNGNSDDDGELELGRVWMMFVVVSISCGSLHHRRASATDPPIHNHHRRPLLPSDDMDHSTGKRHRRNLIVLKIISRLLVAAFLSFASFLPLFDSSPSIILPASSPAKRALRWDAIHFAHVAQNGYKFEYEFAFFPGTHAAMMLGAEIGRFLGLFNTGGNDPTAVIAGGSIASGICDILSVLDLYE